METLRAGRAQSRPAPSDRFTGTVRIDGLFNPAAPDRVKGALVTLEPGARTAWHTHPLDQTLMVTAGLRWVRRGGGPVQHIRPGDVDCFAPGARRRHRAPQNAMCHIAIRELDNGKGRRLDGPRRQR